MSNSIFFHLLTRLLLPLPPFFQLLPLSVLLSARSTLLVAGDDQAVERALRADSGGSQCTTETENKRGVHALKSQVWYLDAVLPLTQRAVTQRGSAEMGDGLKLPWEGDVSTLTLRQQILVLHLLLHLCRNPELMLRG